MYEDLNVRIPPGTSSHSVLTLSDRGFKKLDAFHGHGDHFVNLNIKVPSQLTQEQKDLIKEFAYLENDTPGTVNGIDRSRPRPSNRQRQSESETANKSSNASAKHTEPNYKPSKNTDPDLEESEGFFAKLKRKLIG